MQHRRVIIVHPGGPEILKVIEEPIPEPKHHEVRVKVLAAGVARADILMRSGQYPGAVPGYPYTPGYDIAGVVDDLGEGTSKFPKGMSVVALTEVGGYAEFVCLPEDDLVPVPNDLDPAEVVSLALNHLTAYQMLYRFANVQPGELVLLHAAASGVGTAQILLGKLAGLTMFGTVSKRKHDIVKELGATPIDYQREDFVECVLDSTKDGVDAVFDPVGGSHLWRSFRTLRKKGRLVAYGEMAITGAQKPKRSENLLHHYLPRLLNYFPGRRTVKWYEVFDENRAHSDWYHHDLATLIALLQESKIKPVIAERLPLEEASRAHELIEASAVSGKIVLILNQ
ncbi:MAG: zinc-binding dehydrogenase [Anaerolineales bacterium]|nr:zinc-binding dehydrogenase [Anaerolineales bacterium]